MRWATRKAVVTGEACPDPLFERDLKARYAGHSPGACVGLFPWLLPFSDGERWSKCALDCVAPQSPLSVAPGGQCSSCLKEVG